MGKRWFVVKTERVSGPWTADEVQDKLRASEFSANDLIWGRGLDGWRPLRWWTQQLSELENEPTVIDPSGAEVWHYATHGKSFGPFSREKLVQELKGLQPIGDMMIWTKGMKEWAPLGEFHDLLSDLGLNKRRFPRSELNGQATLKSDGLVLIASLMSISEGGMSVQLPNSNLVSGQSVSVEIQAPSAFRSAVTARAEVRYNADGVVGMRFTNLNPESKAAIIQFVRQGQTRFVLKAS